MKSIVLAEKAYNNANGRYVSVTPYRETLSEEPQIWEATYSGGFETLSFEPEDGVRGSYSVSITKDGFRVLGISDIDGDGVFATYVATESMEASLQTPSDVY